ncbi:MAG: NAD(P)H-binding protein [Patescibacteria group bacterium]
MRIAVIAANGRSGKAFVEAALEAGHIVHAGSFTPGTLKPHPNLIEIKCDATNEADVANLLLNQEAVASFIGHVKGSSPTVQTDATGVTVKVMQKLGISRLVSLTGTGVRFPGDKITLTDRFLNIGVSVVDPNRVSDGRMHVEAIKKSGLDWTVIRVLKLQNVLPKPFSLQLNGPTKPFVGREEVALAVLEVLEQASFIQQAPIISPVKK